MLELGSAKCNQCGEGYLITRFACEKCSANTEGRYSLPRLARLSPEDRRFVELFVLAEGSIKGVGRTLGISYPTVRNRLDKVISSIRAELAEEAQDAKPRRGGK